MAAFTPSGGQISIHGIAVSTSSSSTMAGLVVDMYVFKNPKSTAFVWFSPRNMYTGPVATNGCTRRIATSTRAALRPRSCPTCVRMSYVTWPRQASGRLDGSSKRRLGR